MGMGAEESKVFHPKTNNDRAKWKLSAGAKPKLHEPDFRPPSTRIHTREKVQAGRHRGEVARDKNAHYRYQNKNGRYSDDLKTESKHTKTLDDEGNRGETFAKENRFRDNNASNRHRYRSNSDSSVFVATSHSRKRERRKPSPRHESRSKSRDEGNSGAGHGSDAEGKRDVRAKSPKRREKKSRNDKTDRAKIEKELVQEGVQEQPITSGKAKHRSSAKDRKSKSRNKHGKKSKKRKTKVLEKQSAAYHSAPDLTNVTDAKVGEWLNGTAYYWPPSENHSAWSNPYRPAGYQRGPCGIPGPQGTVLLTPVFPSAHIFHPKRTWSTEEDPINEKLSMEWDTQLGHYMQQASNSETLFQGPNGALHTVPKQSTDGTLRSFYGDSRTASMPRHPYFFPAYPYMIPPQMFFPSDHMHPSVQVDDLGYPFRGRSLSDDHAESLQRGTDDAAGGRKKRKQEIQNGKNVFENKLTRAAVSAEDLSYRANQAIDVDEVKVAAVGRNGEVTSPPPSVSSTEESLSDSSFNDVAIDSLERGMHMFQPVSNREVFIDDTLSWKSDENAAQSPNAAGTSGGGIDVNSESGCVSSGRGKQDSMEIFAEPKNSTSVKASKSSMPSPRNETNQTIMTLCERESIVATSFVTSGGKVFCLTRSKSDAVGDDKTRKPSSTSSVTSESKSLSQTKVTPETPKREGVWFGLTGSPPAFRPKVTRSPVAKSSAIPPLKSLASGSSSNVGTSNDVTTSKAATSVSKPPTKSRNAGIKPEVPLSRSVDQLSGSGQVTSSLDASNTQQSICKSFEPPQTNLSRLQAAPRAARSPPAFERRLVTTSQKDLMEGRLFPTGCKRTGINPDNKQEPNFLLQEYEQLNKPSLLRGRPGGYPFSSFEEENEVFVAVNTEQNKEVDNSFGSRDYSSSDSDEPLYRSNSSLTNKLVRIDSHDSITMRRRIRSSRHHSHNESFDRRATIGSVSRQDLLKAQNDVSGPDGQASPVNPFSHADSSEIGSFLTKAKSEEVLRKDISKSTEELVKWKPRQRKETLQERAARILGLTSQQLVKAKQKTADAAKQSSVPQPSAPVSSEPTNPANDNVSVAEPASESFAVSVTSSMIDNPQEKYTVKSVKNQNSIDSEDEASTLSACTSLSSSSDQSEEKRQPREGEKYLVNVSDSVLGVEVPCCVKPCLQSQHPPTEYKADEIFQKSDPPRNAKVAADQVTSLARTYSQNIYENSPDVADLRFASRDYGDDSSESDSRDGSVSSTESSEGSEQLPDYSFPAKMAGTNHAADFSQERRKPVHRQRAVESPVPVASHSAPLTPVELDIVMQLYNSADEAASKSGKEKTQRQVKPDKSDAMKMKVAKAIGLNPRLVKEPSKSTEPEIARVEDFDIKVFRGSAENVSTASAKPRAPGTSHSDGNQGDVLQAMQSVGLDPAQSWLVSV